MNASFDATNDNLSDLAGETCERSVSLATGYVLFNDSLLDFNGDLKCYVEISKYNQERQSLALILAY